MIGEAPASDESSKRWGGISRLFGEEGLQRLLRAHVMVVGIGGVGSWAAEMLARSGVGKISLVDMDDVCESNINRQIHALQGTIGRSKVAVMAERIREIHPGCVVVEHHAFFTSNTAESLLQDQPDWVFDAIDSMRHKVLLITLCKGRGIPLLVSGGAGGRSDPTRVTIEDLSRSHGDALLMQLRKQLRQKHRFTRDLRRKFGIPCLYSPEPPRLPVLSEGSCEADPQVSLKLDCATGYGTAGFVTATFGICAAGHIVRSIAENGSA